METETARLKVMTGGKVFGKLDHFVGKKENFVVKCGNETFLMKIFMSFSKSFDKNYWMNLSKLFNKLLSKLERKCKEKLIRI